MNWTEVLTALIGTGIVALVWKDIVRFFKWFANRPKAKNFREFLEGSVAIDKAMNAIIAGGAQRVMLIRCHNGGSKPTLGKRLYASLVTYEYDRNVFPTGPEAFEKLPLETSYVSMLLELVSHKHLSIDTATLTDPQLRTIYEYQGVKHAEVYNLCARNDSLFYMSIATTEDEPFTEEQLRLFEYEVANIRGILTR